jgi:DNA-binding CsgD family transcriptional regulator
MLIAVGNAWEKPQRLQFDTLLLSRPSGKKQLQVVVFPFTSTYGAAPLGEDRPKVLVVLSDPTSKRLSRGAVLRSLYGLTPTESRLADFMLQACEVRETAEQMRITPGTARFHLKRVLAKTGTRRQSELMRLMLSLPGETQSDTPAASQIAVA